MMNQFVVVDSLVSTNTSEIEQPANLIFYPNPANDAISFKGDFLEAGVLRFYDVNGKILEERNMQELPGSTVPVGHLPRGIVVVEYVSGNIRFVEKLLLQ